MLSNDLNMITIQQIKVFLTLAKNLNFTTTAVELNMTQPGVSKNIMSLEKVLGFPLFYRNKRNVSLTASGKLLLMEWKNVVDVIQKGYDLTQSEFLDTQSKLRIGIPAVAGINQIFWDIINSYKQYDPEVSIEILERDTTILRKNLFDETIDIMLAPSFDWLGVNDKRFEYQYLIYTNAQVAILPTSEFYRCERLTLSDIMETPICVIDPAIDPYMLEEIHDLFKLHRKEMIVGAYYQSNYELYSALSSRNMIHITDLCWQPVTEQIRKVPLEDYYNGLIGIFMKNNKKILVEEFLEVGKKTLNRYVGNVKV